jgi:hypothetical protein
VKSTLLYALLASTLLACSSADSGATVPGEDDTGAPGDDTGAISDGAGSDALPGTDTGPADETGGTDTGGASDTGTATDTGTTSDGGGGGGIKTVFLIVMENHSWSSITSSTSANYINKTLVPMSSYAKQYYNPTGNHPSEPNYIWLEAGDNLGLTTDDDPSSTNHATTTDHLVSQLAAAGVSWKTYQEGIDGKSCPLTSSGFYAVKHNPFLFFDDVTDTRLATSANCIAHVRPYTELAGDLAPGGKVARYNFITPNLCNDMHGATGCPSTNLIKMGNDWLATEVPKILASNAYKDNGVLIVTWDESSTGDGPIGMLVISPLAKGGGYSNSTKYDHSSMLRTMEEIFGVPLLRGAKTATSLSDMFKSYP